MKPLNILLADDSEAAVQAFQAASFDLVLMDVVMPDIGGLEALRRIKAMPAPSFRASHCTVETFQ